MKTYVHDMDVREEGREEGLQEGLKKGSVRTLLDLYTEGMITLDIVKEKTGMSDAQIEEALTQ